MKPMTARTSVARGRDAEISRFSQDRTSAGHEGSTTVSLGWRCHNPINQHGRFREDGQLLGSSTL
jgi:hypothetical protein